MEESSFCYFKKQSLKMFLKHILQNFGAVTVTIFLNSPPEKSSHHQSRWQHAHTQDAYGIVVVQNPALINLEPFTKG